MAKTKLQMQSISDSLSNGLPELLAAEPNWIPVNIWGGNKPVVVVQKDRIDQLVSLFQTRRNK